MTLLCTSRRSDSVLSNLQPLQPVVLDAASRKPGGHSAVCGSRRFPTADLRAVAARMKAKKQGLPTIAFILHIYYTRRLLPHSVEARNASGTSRTCQASRHSDQSPPCLCSSSSGSF